MLASDATQTELYVVRDLRPFLCGAWRLERDVEDRRAAVTGRLSGRAIFRPDGPDLRYREDGTLSLGDYRGVFYRSYRYRFPDSARAAVAFEDARPFHELDLSRGAWRATHHCGADLYEGRFTVSDEDTWCAVWRVTGPRKDWLLSSRFQRMDERGRKPLASACR